MITYRIAKAAFCDLNGEGARLYGGRWNSPGRPMIYTASAPSLALLELLVHLDLDLALLPDDYRLLAIDVPDAPEIETHSVTSTDALACTVIGDEFLRRGKALALSVPSAIVPQERNLLINPYHPQAPAVRVVSNEAFPIDPRLLSR